MQIQNNPGESQASLLKLSEEDAAVSRLIENGLFDVADLEWLTSLAIPFDN